MDVDFEEAEGRQNNLFYQKEKKRKGDDKYRIHVKLQYDKSFNIKN